MSKDLEALKHHLAYVEAQIKSLAKMRDSLQKSIGAIEQTAALAQYGLVIGEPLAITDAFIAHNRLREWELQNYFDGPIVYIAAVHFEQEQIAITSHEGGIGVSFGATFEMAQGMKQKYAALQV